MSKLPTVLGTGLSGLVGSGVVKNLNNVYNFYNLDLTHGVDILDISSIEEAVKQHPAPVMIHFAGFTNVDAAQQQNNDTTGSCYQVNVQGTKNVSKVCQEQGIHLIHISTGYVFDGEHTGPYLEDDAVNPRDWYSQTKTEAEQLLLKEHSSATIVRINFPYRQDEFEKLDIWHKTAAALQAGKVGPWFADHYFTTTPIEWLAKVLSWMVKKQPAGVFHATTSTVYSDFSWAQTVQVQIGLNNTLQASSVHEYNRQADRPYQPSLILNNQKLKKAMGTAYPDEC